VKIDPIFAIGPTIDANKIPFLLQPPVACWSIERAGAVDEENEAGDFAGVVGDGS
jgi:hypothetical protein